MPALERDAVKNIVAGLPPADYVRKKVKMEETPEEEEERKAEGRPAAAEADSEDDEAAIAEMLQ